MIHFNPETRTFNLTLHSSVYAMQVDHKDRLVHLAWGPRPVGGDALLSGKLRPILSDHASFEFQTRRDEIVTFGDTTTHEVTLKASFATLPEPLPDGVAPHLPIRDVRLRYVSHEVVTDAQPGLAPAHGWPSQPRTAGNLAHQAGRSGAAAGGHAVLPPHPAQDIIERWLELENTGDAPIGD
ncbi:MAG: hypothetical protein H6656_08210 [Ardenticatenaceae bacterium]|nr:hypothetical protein [Ardenticatenaceae bacterium]